MSRTRRVTSILLITVGLLVSILAGSDLVTLNRNQTPIGTFNGKKVYDPGFYQPFIVGQGPFAYLISYTLIGVGIFMIIGGIWLMRRGLRKS